MKTIHLANTEFEHDLQGKNRPLRSYQLSFLPTLYREEGEGVVVYGRPQSPIPLTFLENDVFTAEEIIPWGYSPFIERLAAAHQIPYHTPSWELVREVNSKLFSFENSPPLPGACILKELKEWKRTGPWILKSPFGTSGMGKVIVQDGPLPLAAIRFCERVWEKGELVLAEPWVDRLLDFSSQWKITPDKIAFIGMTKMVNTPHGAYLGSVVGDESELFGKWLSLVDEHKRIALQLLQKVQQRGYFGPVGVDAFIWGEGRLHPVVEINARQTMAMTALQFQKKRFPGKTLTLFFGQAGESENPLLPDSLTLANGKRISFPYQLYCRL